MSRFLALADAAPLFGYPSGPSLRKAFERGLLPGNCLLRVGSRVLRVDVDKLAEWIRTSVAKPPLAEGRS